MKPDETKSCKTALVIGANGVIGRNLIEYLMTLPEWDIIGVSRRGGGDSRQVRYVAIDLLNEEDAREKLGNLSEVTHIFYAAYQDRPTWAELVPPNLTMLVNVVNAIEPIAPSAHEMKDIFQAPAILRQLILDFRRYLVIRNTRHYSILHKFH